MAWERVCIYQPANVDVFSAVALEDNFTNLPHQQKAAACLGHTASANDMAAQK